MPPAKPACAACGKTSEKLQRCARCKGSVYCSRGCQRRHWPVHKATTCLREVPTTDSTPALASDAAAAATASGEGAAASTTAAQAASGSSTSTSAPGASETSPPRSRPTASEPLPGVGSRYVWVPSPSPSFKGRGWPAPNILVLLHGLGDTETRYADLARAMGMPGVEALAVRAPHALLPEGSPELGMPGAAWYAAFEADGHPIDGTAPGETRRLATLDASRKMLHVLFDGLGARGFPPKAIFLLGYGQGGVAALDAALAYRAQLGGVVAASSDVFLAEAAAGHGKQKKESEQQAQTPATIAARVASTRGWQQRTTPIMLTRSSQESPVVSQAQHAAIAAWATRVEQRQYAESGLLKGEQAVRDFYAFIAPLLVTSLEAMAEAGDVIPVGSGAGSAQLEVIAQVQPEVERSSQHDEHNDALRDENGRILTPGDQAADRLLHDSVVLREETVVRLAIP